MTDLAIFLTGLGIGLSLILAIGAQNAFVLRQGLRGSHVLPVVLTCALSDAVLIVIGITSFARIAEILPWISPLMRFGGAAFLIWYGTRAARAALTSSAALHVSTAPREPLRPVLLTALALTWLNPHVYLDTVVLLGTISTQYAPQQAVFGAGAVTGSFLFFFSLGYGARLLRPFFAQPRNWRLLEGGIALVMWAIALKLILMA
ncbi:LysE/ArgO family amino acid transporter [Natronohydrobacter thiooxidans]|uniref:LysE/ArgO family amino acid transporter n=1 Tax=Natronohydrobacter thiooxidans TaxID=87172 RepID=UPI0008FF76B1|nr:LysE/ArgO family amino acid transporter [Natronohydrobacter thiooxidans]